MPTRPVELGRRTRSRLPPARRPAFTGCLLNQRELAALRQLARGLTVAQAAPELHCSASGMHSLLQKAYRRIGVSTAAEAVAVCIQVGWLDTMTHDGKIVELADRRVTWAQRLYLEAFDQSLRAGDDSAELERTRVLRDAALTGLLREAHTEPSWRVMATDPLERIAGTLRRFDERAA